MRHEIPAVATVLALAGTGLLASGAQAAEPVPAPTPAAAPQQTGAPSPRELTERVADTLKVLRSADRPATRPSPRAAKQQPASGPSARIIGGKHASIASAPWMAQLYFTDAWGDSYSCGGAVIAPTKVVTAAHCVDGINWKRDGAIVTGADRVPTESGSGLNLHGGQLSSVQRQWQHAKYDDWSLNNDVAVLTLAAPVKAKPLPIMKSGDTGLYKAGTDGKVYGWGLTGSGPGAQGSDRLKVADADAQSDANCKKAYGSNFKAGTMYCAGRAPTGKDSTSETSCNGDSGGPLVAGGRLVGIVSWGDLNCSAKGKYGVYAKVSAYQAQFRARAADTNWSGDQYADLLARTGKTLYAWNTKSGKTLARGANLGDFSGVNLMVQADLNRDGRQELLYRSSAGGDVYWANGSAQPKLVTTHWRSHKQILVPGDLTGDEIADVVVVTTSGSAWMYPGKGNGTFGTSVKVGTGWNEYSMVRGRGDFTGDGKADVLGHVHGGKIYVHKGTGDAKKPFSGRVQMGTHSGLNALATTGDVNADGHADLLARDMKGKLWLYPGSGTSSAILGKRSEVASGLSGYNLFG
ncbi:trypsin-like serine protease [Streptomyces sp. NPDC001985]|uniref:trypsin-like serine protease n=1 Tax=Streptomyces sp. NPDC001985 TaxID=3154406 RepID=UPI0033262EA2